jgi:NAD(P)H dehydrogenase (quinone)
MLALIIIANPSRASFSHAMADVAEAVLRSRGYRIARHDLYAEGFDPVQRIAESSHTTSDDGLVEQHCRELGEADLVLLFHPNWWSQPPAIMKGWVDRVFRLNTAYRYPEGVGFEGVPVGMLTARHAIVFNTSNTPPEREAEVFGDPLDRLWKTSVFGLCGVSSVIRRMVGPITGSTVSQRAEWLLEVERVVAGVA